MPEYRYPGVYVEEESAGSPIEGVSTSSAAFESLAGELRRAVRAYAPEWAGSNESDPGSTVLEVLAFLAEALVFREDAIPERARAAAARAAETLSALGAGAPCERIARPRYFAGRLLDAETLSAEQEYQRRKWRRHNRALLGFGVVSGLSVAVEPGSGGGRVVVGSGYGVDRLGEEVCVPSAVSLAAPSSGGAAFVTLRSWERAEPAGSTPGGAAWIEEACLLGVSAHVVAPAFALARLVREAGEWKPDPSFRVPRASLSA